MKFIIEIPGVTLDQLVPPTKIDCHGATGTSSPIPAFVKILEMPNPNDAFGHQGVSTVICPRLVRFAEARFKCYEGPITAYKGTKEQEEKTLPCPYSRKDLSREDLSEI